MPRSLERFLFPRSAAFIGGSECAPALEQTQRLGFKGPVWAVHPRRRELAGLSTLASVADLPTAPDAAFIAVKREPTIEIVRELSARGCGGAVIYASGFSETGDIHLQQALLEAANGMPLMGPNCYGFINYLSPVALWPDEQGGKACQRGVAIVTQSGNLAVNFTMTRRGLPLAAIFTLGNQADTDMAAVLETLCGDDRITAIGLHIEGLPDAAAFGAAAEKARQSGKPVVALKTGRSEQGAKVTMSHTNSLAGTDALYDALFARLGIARVTSITAFVETLKFLHHGGPLTGGRIASLSCSGGEAALVADLAEGRKISFPPFDSTTRTHIAATLNEYVTIDNPLDYHTFIWDQADKLEATFSATLQADFDCGMLILDIPTNPDMNAAGWEVTARAFARAAEISGARAALVATLPECLPEPIAEELSALDVAPMAGLDDALTAFEAAATIGRNWQEHRSGPPLAPTVLKSTPISCLSEFQAKERLNAYGLAVPKSVVCAVADAAAAAAGVGFPVALKASGADLAHKTEVGGVRLDLRNERDVERAAKAMADLSPELLVEAMVTGAVAELIVGARHDPQFGHALVIGAGGILTELLEDSITLLLPTNETEIAASLEGLKVARLIKGFRGRAGDHAATVKAIAAIARFVEDHADRLDELDINPLLVLAPGRGVVAVDALIRLHE